MRRKYLTDKLFEYIFNRVVSPQVEYLTQLTIFMPAECHAICVPVRTLFKNKMGLAISAPNYVTDCPLFIMYSHFQTYNSSHIFQNCTNKSIIIPFLAVLPVLKPSIYKLLNGCLHHRYPIGHTNT